MQHSETFAQVAAALAVAQGAFPTIPRDRTVTVQPRPKRKADGTEYWPQPYSFRYAPLETILEHTRPHLSANGLALLQSVVTDDKGAEFVRSLLVHASGEWMANEIPVFTSGADNASQAYASGLTYARRYGVTLLLCVAADEDDDAGSNDEGERVQRPQQGGRNGRQQRAPERKAEAPAEPRAKEPADGEAPPNSAPLHEGAQRLFQAKAKAAGLTVEEATKRYSPTMANFNDVLASLSALANGGAQ